MAIDVITVSLTKKIGAIPPSLLATSNSHSCRHFLEINSARRRASKLSHAQNLGRPVANLDQNGNRAPRNGCLCCPRTVFECALQSANRNHEQLFLRIARRASATPPPWMICAKLALSVAIASKKVKADL
jgi:hypothetical protein